MKKLEGIERISKRFFFGYSYGFNGKEKLDELHDNSADSYDFGARILDVRLGRWLSVDKLELKYPAWSPYNFVKNMPIIAIDPDGNDIHIKIGPPAIHPVTGVSIDPKAEYTRMVNEALGNKFELVLTPIEGKKGTRGFNYMATLVLKPGAENVILDKQQQAFYDKYKAIESDHDVVAYQSIVACVKGTDGGNWILAKTDVADLAVFDEECGGSTSGGVIIHELTEQYEKSKLGLLPNQDGTRENFTECHAKAIEAMNPVNGNVFIEAIDRKNNPVDYFEEADCSVTYEELSDTSQDLSPEDRVKYNQSKNGSQTKAPTISGKVNTKAADGVVEVDKQPTYTPKF
jgi:RHS repeat-associated protein